jgi:hypothetical protein
LTKQSVYFSQLLEAVKEVKEVESWKCWLSPEITHQQNLCLAKLYVWNVV